MGTIQTLLQVKADATQAVAGLKPLQTSLNQTAASAKSTESALNELGSGSHTVSLNDAAIKNAQTEIARLRAQMRDQLTTDIDADTRPAQARIRQLQSSIKTLGQEPVKVEVDVDESVSSSGGLSHGVIAGLAQAATSGALTGLPKNLTAITSAARLAGPAVEEAGAAFLGADAAAGTLATGGLLLIPIVLAGVAAAAVDLGFKLAAPAAQVESLQASLNSLTGGKGVETLTFLQQWAKATPFELADATQAFQLLASAGVPLDQMSDDLEHLGNVAAANQVNLGALTLPISQMISSQKASFENIQQLVELAHVPAWDILAKKLGLTVAETQKLASEGKLGADAVQLLIDNMDSRTPTGMADQMNTLNGQLSSLQDTMTQTKQTISSVFLPAVESIAPVLQDFADIAQDAAILWVAAVKKITDNPIAKTALLPLEIAAKSIHIAAIEADNLTTKVTGAKDATKDFSGGVADSTVNLDDAASSAQAYADKLKGLQDQVQKTADALGTIGVNIRTKVSFIISQSDLRRQIIKEIKGVKPVVALQAKKGPDGHPAIEGVTGVAPITLPANLNINQIGGLGDKQQQLVSDLSDFAQAGLEEGARRAKLDPNFDVRSFDLNVRRQVGELLIKAGVDPTQVNRVLDNVIGIPRTVVIRAAVKAEQAQAALFKLEHPHYVSIVPFIDEKAARQNAKGSLFSSLLSGAGVPIAGKKAPITPSVDPTTGAAAVGTLNDIATPGGQPRDATVQPVIDHDSLRNVRKILKGLGDPITKTITLNTVGGGPGRTNPDLIPKGRNLAPSSNNGGGGGGGGARGASITLAPKQTPVSVFLDGHEISSRLELRRSLAATESVRRSA